MSFNGEGILLSLKNSFVKISERPRMLMADAVADFIKSERHCSCGQRGETFTWVGEVTRNQVLQSLKAMVMICFVLQYSNAMEEFEGI